MPTPKLEMITIEITGLAVNTIPPYRTGGDLSFRKLLTSYPVHRRLRSPDGQGGYTESFVYSHSIEGRIRPAAAFNRVNADKDQALISHVLNVLEGSDIKKGDRVIVGKQSIEILTITTTSTNHHLTANCEELQNGV